MGKDDKKNTLLQFSVVRLMKLILGLQSIDGNF